MYRIDQLAPSAQLKAAHTVEYIIVGHKKAIPLGLNIESFKLATKELKFDVEGNVLSMRY